MAGKAKRNGTGIGELSFSWTQLRAEIDQLKNPPKKATLTPEHIEFLDYCRSGNKPLMWSEIHKLWIRMGWRQYSADHIRRLYMATK